MTTAENESDKMTGEMLDDLEKRIASIYRRTANELTEKINGYLKNFEEKDAGKKALVDDGELPEEDYVQWRTAQIARGEEYEAMRDSAAEAAVNADKIAAEYINDITPDVFALNHNYAAYQLESAGINVNFTLYDKNAVRRLIEKLPDLLPPCKIDIPADLRWNRRKITEEITQAILQGDSIPKMAKRMKNVADMDKNAAVRNARTAITGAQNAGRVESYRQAAKQGIKVKKRWVATLDGRTRHAHRALDGQTVDNDKPFRVDGEEIMYPGDPDAAPYLIYNCRCTLIADIENVTDDGTVSRIARGGDGENYKIKDMTYSEWVKSKGGNSGR